MMLSENFSYAEAIVSEVAARMHIDNSPPRLELAVIERTATKMEKVRIVLNNKPIHINSWYRCPALNALLKSNPSSQHTFGEAVDFICPEFGTPLEVCKAIVAQAELINYDQLILEHSWIHISFAILSGKPRNQVISLLQSGGYATGLTDIKGNPHELQRT